MKHPKHLEPEERRGDAKEQQTPKKRDMPHESKCATKEKEL